MNNETTVLLVEDEALIALAEERILSRNGLRVFRAGTGEAAVTRVAEDDRIDLVLMDINLGPGIDGTEAARRILENRQMPIIFLTSHSEKEYVDRVKAITRYGYVLKTSGEFVLLEAIAMALELFRANEVAHRRQREAEQARERLQETNLELEVSNQQLREAELQRAWADQQYRLLFTHMTNGFALHEMIFDAAGTPADYRFLDVNPAYEELTGLTAERVLGKRVLEILPETEGSWIEMYGQVVLTGESVRFVDFSSALRKFFSVTAFRPAAGQFAVIVEDVTEQRLAVERLREREQFLDGVIRTSRDGYWEADTVGVVVDVNEAYAAMSGYSREELIGSHISRLDATEDPEDTARRVDELLRTGSATFETVHRRKDGTTFDAEAAVRYLPGNGGRFVAFIRDVTERNRFMEAQQREIEERTCLLQEFGHRVKNNLAMISSLIAMKGASLGEEVDLSDIQRQVRVIEVLHEKLLIPENVSEIDLAGYVSDFLPRIVSFGSGGPIAVDQTIEHLIVPTRIAITLGMLIAELVTNAIKHGFPGTSEHRLGVSCVPDGELCRLVVTNSGAPLPPGFDATSTGTLGMRLINAMVAQLEGRLSVRRDPLTAFVIEFPLKPQGSRSLIGA
jgi:two-component system, sensor histidine kinase PdtaS